MIVELPQDYARSLERLVLSVDLHADVDAESDPPQLPLLNAEDVCILMDGLLKVVPSVKIFEHTNGIVTWWKKKTAPGRRRQVWRKIVGLIQPGKTGRGVP